MIPPEFATQLILPFREYLLAGFTAAVITFLLVGPVRVLALRLGAVAWPRGRDVHVTPTPRWGGVAMLGGVLAGVGMAYQLPALRLAFDSFEVLAVMGAAVLLVVVGALDDKYDLDALTKFAGQITAAGVLVIFGIQLYVFYIPWGGDGPGPISGSILVLGTDQSALLTVLLTVALVNAMNFVDGLDGLAAGIGMIAATAIGLFAIGLVHRVGNDPTAYSPALIAVVLAGACLGFLPHNFNPARIFMGDSGSMLIGLLLAAATTSASGRMANTGLDGTDFIGLFAPLIVLAAVGFVPLLDLLLAVVRRTRKGRSPFSPDKMHLHHRMLEIGHSHRRAVLLIYLWAGVLAFGAVALALIEDVPLVLWTSGAGLLIAVIATVVPRERRRAAVRAAADPVPAPPARPMPVPPAGPVPVPPPGPVPGPPVRPLPVPPGGPRPGPPTGPLPGPRPVPPPAGTGVGPVVPAAPRRPGGGVG